MTKLPLVSIVVPVYNTGTTLDLTIESVLNQTYGNIELIVVNDGSIDDFTIKKLNTIKNTVNIVDQENMGLPAARNTGISLAKGKYIVCLDSDDYINKKYVKKAVGLFELINDDNLAIVSSYIQAFGSSREQWHIPDFDINKIKYSNVLPVASMFLRSVWEEVGGYDENFRKGFEDWDFWLSILGNGYRWAVLKDPLFYYRRKKVSMITESNKARGEINLAIYNKHSGLYCGETKDSVLSKMDKAETERATKNNKMLYQKIFSRYLLRRFSLFR